MKPFTEYLIINRFGRLTAKSKVSNQCKVEGHRDYDYHVKVKCESKLDGQDFLIDHVAIDLAVQYIFAQQNGSCERLAINFADEVVKTMINHGCKVRKIYVQIKPVLQKGQKTMAFMELKRTYGK